MYGKVMSIPDSLMIRYFELVTDISLNEIDQIKINLENDNLHPQDVKKKLAREIVKLYHGQNAALIAEEEFEKVFNKKLYPEEMKELVLKKDNLKEGKIWLIKLISLSGLINSKSEARRLIEQGGVKINGEKVDDPNLDLTVKEGMVVKIGKFNFVKLVIR
jgi:tyrosyl-tRNA synthetase